MKGYKTILKILSLSFIFCFATLSCCANEYFLSLHRPSFEELCSHSERHTVVFDLNQSYEELSGPTFVDIPLGEPGSEPILCEPYRVLHCEHMADFSCQKTICFDDILVKVQPSTHATFATVHIRENTFEDPDQYITDVYKLKYPIVKAIIPVFCSWLEEIKDDPSNYARCFPVVNYFIGLVYPT